ncbi:MAG TPA: tRNA (adenosine(37)-N6)-dimethylallyltransferase MiaA [Verrucomicrobiae bacterium]|nr:tRNA (adenosine(37)-N6)-dimethylallyltransferase MiaA [Verrucomicrobiae bacterium]
MTTDPVIHPPSSPRDSRSLFLAGPTAVGKSQIALALAEKIGGEIISVDSMQVYRGLDIGTAKPSPAERERVPHHLLDLCELDEPFDVARFIRLAKQATADIQSRNRVPLFCGGTGLYFKGYLSGLGEAPAANPELRAQLEALPFETLLHELRESDPAAYEKIDKQNPRRVIRAVEVIRVTGKKFSEQRANWKEENAAEPGEPLFCFRRAPDDLRQRMDRRVEEMFRRGLVAETEQLLSHGLEKNQTAMQAIGYRQVVEHLRGERSLADTIELVKIKTRQFAKRQLTWFRSQKNVRWVELPPGDAPEEVVKMILAGVGPGKEPPTADRPA